MPFTLAFVSLALSPLLIPIALLSYLLRDLDVHGYVGGRGKVFFHVEHELRLLNESLQVCRIA